MPRSLRGARAPRPDSTPDTCPSESPWRLAASQPETAASPPAKQIAAIISPRYVEAGPGPEARTRRGTAATSGRSAARRAIWPGLEAERLGGPPCSRRGAACRASRARRRFASTSRRRVLGAEWRRHLSLSAAIACRRWPSPRRASGTPSRAEIEMTQRFIRRRRPSGGRAAAGSTPGPEPAPVAGTARRSAQRSPVAADLAAARRPGRGPAPWCPRATANRSAAVSGVDHVGVGSLAGVDLGGPVGDRHPVGPLSSRSSRSPRGRRPARERRACAARGCGSRSSSRSRRRAAPRWRRPSGPARGAPARARRRPASARRPLRRRAAAGRAGGRSGVLEVAQALSEDVGAERGRPARISAKRFGPSSSSRTTISAQRSPTASSARAIPQASP